MDKKTGAACTGACWVPFSWKHHLPSELSCCWSQMLFLLERLQGKQENWCKNKEIPKHWLFTNDASSFMVTAHHTRIQDDSAMKKPKVWQKLQTWCLSLHFSNPFSCTTAQFNSLFKSYKFLICLALISCSVCSKLYCSYMGFGSHDAVNSLLHIAILHQFEMLLCIKQACFRWDSFILQQ